MLPLQRHAVLIVAAISSFVSSGAVSHADDTLTIVAFGDSTTAARGDLAIYADLLAKELPRRDLPVRVINAGIGGNNTQHARARFEKDVLDHDPDTVIVQFGINDAAVDVWHDPPATEPRVSLMQYEKNLRHFIDVLGKSDVRVILMTPNPLRWTSTMRDKYGKPPYMADEMDGFNVLLKSYATTVLRIAKENSISLVDVYGIFEEYGRHDGYSVSDLLLDGIHPNERGHRLIADELMTALLSENGKSHTERNRSGHQSPLTLPDDHDS